MEELYGLCAGRHEMDVAGYIFDRIDNVFDYDEIHRVAKKFIREHCDVHDVMFDDGFKRPVGDKTLRVVVTGLSALTAEIVGCCAELRTNLALYHYDRDTGEYRMQAFRFSRLL